MGKNKTQKTPQKTSKPTKRFRECSTTTEDMVSSESEAEDDSISDSLSGKIKQILIELRALREIKAIVGEARQEIHALKETVTKLKAENESIKLRLLDQETRSRRGNLLFYGIAESENEDTDRKVKDFITKELDIPADEANDVVIQRSHRLGRRIPGRKPRAIIAALRDEASKVRILKNTHRLAGKVFGVQQDFPEQIREARKRLWPELKKAKREGRRARILFPAALQIEGRVVANEFPSWGAWNDRPECTARPTADGFSSPNTTPVRERRINADLPVVAET